MRSPEEIVGIMLRHDAFSEWMNLEVLEISKGKCTLSCTTTEQMLNGFAILHGGITYSLSDSALAFSANSYGFKCVSVETSISHLRPVGVNETLTVKCIEIHRGKTIGMYNVDIYNSSEELISKFKGTVNISKEIW